MPYKFFYIDDMWERADRANRAALAARQKYIENGDSVAEQPRSMSGIKDEDGNFVTTSTNQEGKTVVNKKPLRRDKSYTNQIKFYRVPHGNRQEVGGYGIGLYYVKSILEKMGWDIDVKSKEREGSIFTIKINNNGQ